MLFLIDFNFHVDRRWYTIAELLVNDGLKYDCFNKPF